MDPFLITNKFSLTINGFETKSPEIFSILTIFPRLKSTIIIFPSEFVKYKFVLPIANPTGLISFLFLIL